MTVLQTLSSCLNSFNEIKDVLRRFLNDSRIKILSKIPTSLLIKFIMQYQGSFSIELVVACVVGNFQLLLNHLAAFSSLT